MDALDITPLIYLVVLALDNLPKQRWSVLDRLGKDLQQVALIVIIDENLELLQHINRLQSINKQLPYN